MSMNAAQLKLCEDFAHGRISEARYELEWKALEAQGSRAGEMPRARRPFAPERLARFRQRRHHRAHLAGTGFLPPRIFALFSDGERAVLTVIALEVMARGSCAKTLKEIADRANVCRDHAKRTIRRARTMGLLRVTEQPRGNWNGPNVVEIVLPEWSAWLSARASRRAGNELRSGGRTGSTSDRGSIQKGEKSLARSGWRGQGSRSWPDDRPMRSLRPRTRPHP